MAYRVTLFLMTLVGDLEGHSSNVNLSKCDFSHSCVEVDEIN